jgi:hypothetical protein
MNTPKTTAKDFFLWAGAMIALYWSVIAFIFLIFDYINYAFPNALAYYPADPYASGISGEMASIIVLLPVALLLMRFIRRDIALDASKSEIWVRRWAVILTLFVAGVAVVGDLIMLLTTFLNGEALTTAFLLKVLTVFLVAAGVFMHFIADLKGYWTMYPARKRMVVIAVAVLAVVSIVSGFLLVGTPYEARRARFDDQKLNDLVSLQSQIVYYWQAKQVLPRKLSDLNNSLSYGPVPVDPETGEAYGYEATGPLSFKICALFNAEGSGDRIGYYGGSPMSVPEKPFRAQQDNWQHGSGTVCFDRTIDPSFYPPLKK